MKKTKARGTREELEAFAVLIGLPASDGGNCFDKWESTGWENIRDWQAKMRSWKGDGFHTSQKKPLTGGKSTLAQPPSPRIVPDLGPRGQNFDVMDLNAPPPEDHGSRESPNEKPDLPGIVDAYPRRQDVAQALDHLRASIRKGADPAVVLAGTRAIAAVISQLPSGALNAYVPSAATFFKNERWKDDPGTWLRNAGSKNGAAFKPLDLGGRRVGEVIR